MSNKKKTNTKKNKVTKEKELSFKDKFIAFFKRSWKRLLVVIILILALWIIISTLTKKGSSAKYVLDKIYDIYPENVRELYQNILDVSCNGDMYFDVNLGGPSVDIKDMNKENLATYVISYLEKNDLFVDGMAYSKFVDTEKELLNTDSDILSKVPSIQYGDYRYVHMGDKIVKQENACVVGEYENLMHLYSYSYNEDYLFVYVNYGRIKEGKLYNKSDVPLSDYNDEVNLDDALIEAPYYIFKFVKDDGKYKLHSVQFLNKA